MKAMIIYISVALVLMFGIICVDLVYSKKDRYTIKELDRNLLVFGVEVFIFTVLAFYFAFLTT